MGEDSLDRWIGRLNGGDVAAMEQVFRAYEPYLRIAIRRKLSRRLRSKVDSEDIVQSAFADILGGFRRGGWHFDDRVQLFAFLRKVAWRRLADRYEKHRAVLEREQPLPDGSARGLPQSSLPRPSQVAQGREFEERALQSCPPAHREIVRLRMEGLRIGEIAGRTGLHEGSVRRILYDLARRLSIAKRAELQPRAEVG
jgi:RNA polymerase sigma factor (sigma-70 family)